MEKGYISKLKSPYASPFFFIKNKDRKLCPVQDYHKLNEYTIKNKYPLPLIPDLITQVKDAWIFTKFDIRCRYNNVCIKEGDQHKAAFKTKYGLFEPNVMYFGLTNSPAMFQVMINHLFQPVHDKFSIDGTDVLKYMDDLLIATRSTKAHHRKAVHKVLDILEANQLFVHPEKCTWESPTVNYLGLILEKRVTCMDPVKIQGIANWLTPTTVKQVWSFMGFCNFYHPFIFQFSHIAQPLNQLTKKDTPWEWGPKQQQAFEKLQKWITSEPVLIQPKLEELFKIEVNASGYTIRAILIQRDEKGKWHPIAYFSATLTDAEQDYNIYKFEFYAIIRALHHWRQFMAGSPHKIRIYTNHQNHQYWKQPHKIPWRIARQAQEIMEYQLELIHIPGKTNSHANMLSRHPDYNQGDKDNKEVVVLPESMFIWSSHTIAYVPEEPLEQNKATLKPWINQYHLKKIWGEWWKDQKKVITQDLDKWCKIIQAYHDCYVLLGLHLLCRNIGLLFFLSPLFPPPKPMYNTDLVQNPCTIWSAGLRLVRYHLTVISLYDINLRATNTTTLSTRGVTIPIGFVSSTTDSIRQHVVLFKPVTVLDSDPKSEFLCKSSHSCAEPTDPPEPPRTPGISPMPSSPHIILTLIVQVLSQSTLGRSYALSMPNILVTASQFKSNRMFHSNITMIYLHMDIQEFPEQDTWSPSTTGGLPWEKKSTNMSKDALNVNKTKWIHKQRRHPWTLSPLSKMLFHFRRVLRTLLSSYLHQKGTIWSWQSQIMIAWKWSLQFPAKKQSMQKE